MKGLTSKHYPYRFCHLPNKGRRRNSTHKLREGLELQVSCQVAILPHRPLGNVQVTFLKLEVQESLDQGK